MPADLFDPTLDPNTLAASRESLSQEIEEQKPDVAATAPATDFSFSYPGDPRFPDDQTGLDARMADLMQNTKQGDAIADEQLRAYRDYKAARGEKPFGYFDRFQQQRAADDHRENLRNFLTLFAGPKKMADALPEDKRQAFSDGFKSSLDPDRDKMRAVNTSFVENAAGQAVDPDTWNVYRSQFAQQNFGASGPVDEAQFYQLAGDHVRSDWTAAQGVEGASRLAREMTIQAKPLAEGIAEGKKRFGDDWSKYEAAFKASTAGVYARYTDQQLRMAGRISAFSAKQEGSNDGATPGERQAGDFAGYATMSEEDRMKTLSLAISRAQDLSYRVDDVKSDSVSDAIATFGTRLLLGVGSNMKNINNGLAAAKFDFDAGAIQDTLDTGFTPDANAKGMTHPMTDAERSKFERQRDHLKGAAQMLRDLSEHPVQIKGYVDEHLRANWRSVDDAVIQAASFIPDMAMAGSAVGLPLLATSYGERALSRMQEDNPRASREDLEPLAMAAGIGQAGFQKLQQLTLSGVRLPAVQTALGKLGSPGAFLARGVAPLEAAAEKGSAALLQGGVIGKTALFGTRLGVAAGAQSVEVAAQNLMRPAVEELGAAFNQDMPGPDWGKELKREQESMGQYFGLGLVYSVVGVAGRSISERIQAPKLKEALTDQRGMALAGYDQAAAKQIAATAENNPQAAVHLLQAAMKSTTVEQRKANSAQAFERMKSEVSNERLKEAGLPTYEPNPDGTITSTDANGIPTQHADLTGFLDHVRNLDTNDEINTSQATRQLADYIMGNETPEGGFKSTFTFTGESPNYAEWAMDNAAASEQANNRARLYYQEAAIPMGIEGVDLGKFTLLGSNRNEYANGVAEIVSEIHRKGNPLTVLEERSEGVWAALLDQNHLPSERVLGWLRDVELNTSRKILADDWATKTAELQRQDLIEGMRQLTVAHAMGRVEETALPSPVKKFFRAIKTVWNNIMSLAADLKGLKEKGKLDPELERHLILAAGLDQQGEITGARAQADATLSRLLPETPSAETHSIAIEGDPILAKIESLSKNPEARRDTYEKMSEVVREINERQLANDHTDQNLLRLDALEEKELGAAREKILSQHGDDIAAGKNKRLIRDLTREAENRVKERYDRLREKEQAKGATDQARFEKVRDIATLEAIVKALPAGIRGRFVGDFKDLAELQTAQSREKYLVELLPKVDAALETHLQNEYRDAIGKLFDKAEPDVSQGRTSTGKIGAEGHDLFRSAKESQKLTIEQVDASTEPLREQMEGQSLSMEQLEALDERIAAIELFGDFDNADSSRLKDAHDLLTGVYQRGRAEWLGILKARQETRANRVNPVVKAMGFNPALPLKNMITDAARNANSRPGLLKKLDEGVMQAFLSGHQTIRRLAEATSDPHVKAVIETMEGAILDSELAWKDMNGADEHALGQAMRSIFGVSGEWGVSKKLRELSRKEVAPVEKIEGRHEEAVKVPISAVESILRGETAGAERRGKLVEIKDSDMPALRDAWEAFQALDEEGRKRKQVIEFTRVIDKGKRQTIGQVSQLEGLQLWLTMRQADQFEKLEKMGYDSETMADLNKWLKPETQALGLWMVQHIGKEAFGLDALHRAEKGVGLKLVDNYFAVRNDVARAENGELSIDKNAQQFTGKSIGAIKERVKNNAPPAYVNALAVFLANRSQVNFWKSHVTMLREWGGVIRDEKFAAAVKARMGATYYTALNQRLKRIEAGGALRAGATLEMESAIQSMTSNFALGTLGLRASTIAVNLNAGLNFALEVPLPEILKGARDLAANPAAFKDAFNSPAIQRRWREGATAETQQAKSNDLTDLPIMAALNSMAQKGLAPINWADTGAQVIGSAIVWEHTRKNARAAGMDEAAARAEADAKVERVLLRAAQPTTKFGKSEFELMLGQNPVGAMGQLFFSDPRKNMAILYLAGRELLTGKGTNGRMMAAQQLLVGGVILGSLEFAIRSAYQSWAKAGPADDDSFGKRYMAKLSDPKAWAYTLATTHLKSFPVIGEVYNDLAAHLLDQKSYPGQNPISGAAGKIVNQMWKEEKPGHEKTRGEMIDGGISLMKGLGVLVPGGALAAELGNLAETVKGVATSNGFDFSDDDRLERIHSRYRTFDKDLNGRLGKTTGSDGKIQKDVKKAKDQARADQLNGLLQPLTPELRKRLIDQVKPSKDVVKLLKF